MDVQSGMAAVSPRLDGGRDFKAIQERFLAVNSARLARIDAGLRPRQTEALALLPLLFHANHPLLPGYVGAAAPAGIPGYAPDETALAAARRLARGFVLRRGAYRRPAIEALYLMGSTGTIAYAEGSDLDLWICHASGLSDARRAALEQKARGIEAWARPLGLELHCFLVDPARLREGEAADLSAESGGSAVRHLLLDEFYRTGIWLAGRLPLWWFVPPEADPRYAEYTEGLKRKRFIHARDALDFGGLDAVAADEFYGATLWSLYKAIDSPYKALLKVLLMEAYASAFPDVPLLSTRFKEAIYAGQSDADALDPYVMMLRAVEEYLGARGETRRLELARRCLYLKVGKALSGEPRLQDWRGRRMQALVREWGWGRGELALLDSQARWGFRELEAERRRLMEALSHSYGFLSRFARAAGGVDGIDARDLHVLGRRLHVAFERRADKLEVVSAGFGGTRAEARLSLHRLAERPESWAVFSGAVGRAERSAQAPLKRLPSLTALLAWCHFNGLIGPDTALGVYPDEAAAADGATARALVAHLREALDGPHARAGGMAALREPPAAAAMVTLINPGIDPLARRTRRGEQFTSARSDALSYGGLGENLVLRMEQVIVTSWQEVLYRDYGGEEGLFECLRAYLRWCVPERGVRPPPLTARAVADYRGGAIAQRVEGLFAAVLEWFCSGPPAGRYLVAVGTGYCLLGRGAEELEYELLRSYEALLLRLAAPVAAFTPLHVDAQTLGGDVLPAIYAHNAPDVVQVFHRRSSDGLELFVLDERGSLFHAHSACDAPEACLGQLSRFLDAAAMRLEMHGGSPRAAARFYRIEGPRRAPVVRAQPTPLAPPETEGFEVQAIADLSGGGAQVTLHVGARELCSLEHGAGLFEAAVAEILRRRRGGADYPIHLADVDLLLGEGRAPAQTVQLLRYKAQVEARLNAALQRARRG